MVQLTLQFKVGVPSVKRYRGHFGNSREEKRSGWCNTVYVKKAMISKLKKNTATTGWPLKITK